MEWTASEFADTDPASLRQRRKKLAGLQRPCCFPIRSAPEALVRCAAPERLSTNSSRVERRQVLGKLIHRTGLVARSATLARKATPFDLCCIMVGTETLRVHRLAGLLPVGKRPTSCLHTEAGPGTIPYRALLVVKGLPCLAAAPAVGPSLRRLA